MKQHGKSLLLYLIPGEVFRITEFESVKVEQGIVGAGGASFSKTKEY